MLQEFIVLFSKMAWHNARLCRWDDGGNKTSAHENEWRGHARDWRSALCLRTARFVLLSRQIDRCWNHCYRRRSNFVSRPRHDSRIGAAMIPLSLVPAIIGGVILAAIGFYMKFSADRDDRRNRRP